MPYRLKYKSSKIGAAPGALVHVGEQRIEKNRIRLVHYSPENFDEFDVNPLEMVFPATQKSEFAWINIDGIHDVDLIDRIGRHFHIHPLTLEDILNTAHRPKFETFENYGYIVLKMIQYDVGTGQVSTEQVSLILTENVLVSFLESHGEIFEPVRARLRKGQGRIRKAGCDYLAYALVDAVVDHYFSLLDQISTKIESLEDEIIEAPTSNTLQQVYSLKGDIIYLRKQIWPLREVISLMAKEESYFIQENTRLFLRDIHDHTIQIIDTIETQRDHVTGLLDLYMTQISYKMNEVMKVLTIVATLFIPITFIAGVYGMNFRHMPELEWPWGYGLVWGLMIAVVITMVLYFNKKKWL